MRGLLIEKFIDVAKVFLLSVWRVLIMTIIRHIILLDHKFSVILLFLIGF